MVTTREYVKLSMEVYADTTPEGWIRLPVEFRRTRSGFHAAAYRSIENPDEIVIAFRGTDDLADGFADLALSRASVGRLGEHPQFVEALEFAQKVREEFGPGFNITVTGHSLGGGLAQLAADVFGWGGQTFDAPGMRGLTQGQNLRQFDAFFSATGESFGNVGALTNHTVEGSGVSTVPGHIGTENPVDTGRGPAAVALMIALAIPSAPAIMIAATARDQLKRHSVANIYRYFQMQSSAGIVLQSYVGNLLEHGVEGYTAPDRSYSGALSDFFDDLFGSDRLTQDEANALIEDLQFLRDNDPLFLSDAAVRDDLIEAQDMLRVATQEFESVTVDNTHWTEQPGEGNELTIQIDLKHATEQTAQWVRVDLPDTDAFVGMPNNYVVQSGLVTASDGWFFPLVDYYVAKIDPGEDTGLITLSALEDGDREDNRLDLGSISLSLPERDGSDNTVQQVSLSIHEAPEEEPSEIAEGPLYRYPDRPNNPYPDNDPDHIGVNVFGSPSDPERITSVNYSAVDGQGLVFETLGGNDIIALDTVGDTVVDLGDGNDELWSGASTGDMSVQGGSGRDHIVGGQVGVGRNTIEGGAGADMIGGGDNADYLYSDVERDPESLISDGAAQEASGLQGEWINGAAGDDRMFSGADNDFLTGGDGNDLIVAGGGDDFVYGDGNSWGAFPGTYSHEDGTWVDWHNWNYTGGADDSGGAVTYTYDFEEILMFAPGTGDDLIYAGNGDDIVYGQNGGDVLSLEGGEDVGWGGAGDDVVLGGSGDDVISGDNAVSVVAENLHGDDYLSGGEGDDLITGNGGSDVLYGGAGDDQLQGENGDEQGGGDDYLNGGEGSDSLWGFGGSDMLEGGAGDDNLVGGTEADQLFGGEGADRLWGDAGDAPEEQHGGDFLDGGAGDDTLVGGGGDDILLGGAGDDRMWGQQGSNYLDGGEGGDVLVGGDQIDVLVGGAGRDTVFGGDGNDIIDGGEGDDDLQGDGGDDLLFGGGGNDTYRYGLGHGTDHVSDSNGTDWLVFTDATTGDVKSLYLGSLCIAFNDGSEIHLDDFTPDDAQSAGIEFFRFADGAVFTAEQLADRFGIQIDGTSLDDDMAGTALSDHILAYQGDDVVVAEAGNDYVDLGEGDDYVDGKDGDDHLVGGSGHDVLNGDNGTDHLIGGDGNDILNGGPGADTLDGGLGDDAYIVDDAGDTVLENPGGGRDTVYSSVDFALPDAVEDLTLTGVDDVTALGNGGDNVIVGNAGSNTLDGGGGADWMSGGAGNDTYHVDDAGDVVIDDVVGEYETAYGTTYFVTNRDQVHSSVSFVLPENVEDLYLTGQSNIDGQGNELDNRMSGNEGVNVLVGGAGDDRYEVQTLGDSAIEMADEGFDVVLSSVDFELGDHIEQLQLTGSAVSGTGNVRDNLITGTDADNRIDGRGGNDELDGGAGSDTLVGGIGDDVIRGGLDSGYWVGSQRFYLDNDDVIDAGAGDDHVAGYSGNDTIDGGAGDDALYGYALYAEVASDLTDNDMIDGGDGNDLIDGGEGSDRLWGGEGDDQLYGGDDGRERVFDASTQSYVENSNDDFIDGGSGSDGIDGGSGADHLLGGSGNDVIYGGDDGQGDYVIDEFFDEYVAANNDFIDGGDGNDTIDGGSGKDDIHGGNGDDVLYGGDDGSWDVVYDYWADRDVQVNDDFIDGGAGNDLIDGGSGSDVLLGQSGADRIEGGDGGDTLSGGAGVDELNGGAGDDVLYGSRYGGTSAHRVEVIAGAEDDGAIPLATDTGGQRAFVLEGVIGDGPYADPQSGLGWDYDFYRLSGLQAGQQLDASVFSGFESVLDLYDAAGDLVAYDEGGSGRGGSPNEWDASLQITIPEDGDYYLMASDYGNWPYDPFDAASGGDPAANAFYGGEYLIKVTVGRAVPEPDADYLDAAVDLDTMAGGTGDDVYIVDGTYARVTDPTGATADCGQPVAVDKLVWNTDQVIEQAGEGYDVVLSSASFTLGAHVEELRLIFDPDTAPTDPAYYADLTAFGQDGTGNALDNRLVGNDLDNRLDGGAGADTLIGGRGDDTYVVDASDSVVEEADAGIDTVVADHTWSLDGSEIENLTLAGNAAEATGNALDNVLTGNAGNNALYGLAGDDKLIGGAGNDRLVGGLGDDRYVFRPGEGDDTIEDDAGEDVLFIGGGATAADLEGARVGDDLLLGFTTTAESIVLKQWFAQAEGVNRIEFCDGSSLDRAGMEGLVNQPPVAVDDTVTLTEDDAAVVIAPGNLLINDSDPDAGDTLSIVAVGPSETGASVALDADGVHYAIGDAYQGLGEGESAADRFTYEVADSYGATSEAGVTVTVHGANDAPVAAAPLGDQTATQDQAFHWALPVGAFTDIDANDTLAYGVTLADGSPLPDWLTYDAGTNALTGTPDNWDVGTLDVRVQATDPGGLAASSVFRIDVQNVNDAPVAVLPIGDQAATAKREFAFAVDPATFTDDDTIHGDQLAYTATLADGSALPEWMTFDPDTLEFAGTAPKDAAGVWDVMVTATDLAGATASSGFLLDVAKNRGGCHGNEGLGNGEDPPPPGHDHNENDGPGTSPGHPGSKERHGKHDEGSRRDAGHDEDGCFSGDGSRQERSRYLDPRHLEQDGGKRHRRRGRETDPNSLLAHWESMDARLAAHMQKQGRGEDAHGEHGAGNPASGFLGGSVARGRDRLSLSDRHGADLRSFDGLHDGMRDVC